MKTNGDMEPDFPFYDNRSDIFGKVTINADGTPESFDLPEREETDDPAWSSGNYFVSRPAPLGALVHITIHLEEDDWGVTGSNDAVDVSPNTAHNDLEFDFNTCSLRVSGDITGPAGTIHVPSSGTAENQGVLSFIVGMDDGRALSPKGDVVLQAFDLVQVLPATTQMVAGKPAVGVVTIANNTPVKQSGIAVRLRVADGANTIIHDVTEPLATPLEVGEVRSVWLGQNAPVVPTDFSCKPSRLSARADLILPPGTEAPGDSKTACWVLNNSSDVKQWDVVTTKGPSLLWIRVAHLLSATNFASVAQLSAMRAGAMPFIRGMYPAPSISDSASTFPLVPPLSGVVFNFIASLLAAVGLPADYATPYVMIAELSAAAALSGNDRLMGVLPKDWFNGTLYQLMDGITGLSLGTTLPRAVIFEAVSTNSDGANVGPSVTLPAHELGHTYGLSLDPSIKSFWCQLTPSNLGNIACGMAGGNDEYKSAINPDGVPEWGYWVPQGGATTGHEGQQCEATCLMGPSPINAYSTWASNRKLIDAMDYDRLVDKLSACSVGATSAALYVSGVISALDTMVFGSTFLQPEAQRVPDFLSKPSEWKTVYALDLVDGTGAVLAEYELPLQWSEADSAIPLQATFFGGYVRFPPGIKVIRVRNRDSGKVLGERLVSAQAPKVGRPTLKVSGKAESRALDVSWSASDGDGDTLVHFVQVSPDQGLHWWPVAHGLTSPTFHASLADVAPGSYVVRVLSSDGVNVSSVETTITL